MALKDFAIMPYGDYESACDAVREKLGTTDKITSGELAAQIAQIEGGDHPPYRGDYEITPALAEQTVETADKWLSQNIIVKEIPYAETSNLAGGYTITIGG